MAENVRTYIEEALNDFNYLEKKEILTQNQISTILKRREELEYKMARLRSNPVDFLEAIEYEVQWVIYSSD